MLLRGPGGEFEVPFDEAVFGGPARNESRHYWIQRTGAEPVPGRKAGPGSGRPRAPFGKSGVRFAMKELGLPA